MDCFESYKESIKEITNINVDNICNSLTSQSNTEYRLNFLKKDFLLKTQILKKDDNLIYNGKDLIKTVKDSIKWHYAFRGYTFNFDDFCHDEKEFINGMVLYGFHIYDIITTNNKYPYIVIQKDNIFYCNYYKENILIFTSSPTPSSSSPSSSSSHVIKGGAVESYDKQYKIGNVLNQFLKKPEKEENNKKKVEQHIRYNQLCYFIPIKLKFSQDEKEKDVQERLKQNCKTTYESLQLAWGKLLNISKDEKKEENKDETKDEKKEENNKDEKKDENNKDENNKDEKKEENNKEEKKEEKK